MAVNVVHILDYLPSEERLITCRSCKEPWSELLPIGVHPKTVHIECPYCFSEESVINFVPKRLR